MMKRDLIRVAQVSPAYFAEESLIGGGERYVNYLAQAINEAAAAACRPLEQQVFAFGTKSFSNTLAGVRVEVLKDENLLHHPMSSFSTEIWNKLRDFDIVHIHQSLTFFGAYHASVARSLGKCVVMTDLGGGESKLMLAHGGLRLADGLFSISRFAGSLVSGYYDGLTEVSAGPVDTDRFSPPASGSERNRHVLCVGRLLPHKGIDTVIRALPPGLRLIIVGRPYDAHYLDVLRSLSDGKDVTFVEDADDDRLLDLYRTCGLFVQASTFRDYYGRFVRKPELMGLTTLEAMSCGMPCVVSDVASLPELAEDAAYFRTFRDVDNLTDILIEYRDKAWPKSGSAGAARDWIVSQFSFRVVGERALNFYDAVLDSIGSTG